MECLAEEARREIRVMVIVGCEVVIRRRRWSVWRGGTPRDAGHGCIRIRGCG